MKRIYEAILIGDRLEWTGERPEPTLNPQRVTVTVAPVTATSAVPVDLSTSGDRAQLLEALKRVRELNPYRDIADPVAWQREVREDRPLPGRE